MRKLNILVTLSIILGLSSSVYAISLSESGVEGLEKRTTFKEITIKRVFPKFKAKEESVGGEQVIKVKKFTKVYLILHPDKNNKYIEIVEVVHKNVKNKLAMKIDDKYGEVIDKKKHKCVPGEEAESGKVICWNKKERKPKFKFLFSGSWSGPDGKIPPKMVLKRWKVEKIIWYKK